MAVEQVKEGSKGGVVADLAAPGGCKEVPVVMAALVVEVG